MTCCRRRQAAARRHLPTSHCPSTLSTLQGPAVRDCRRAVLRPAAAAGRGGGAAHRGRPRQRSVCCGAHPKGHIPGGLHWGAAGPPGLLSPVPQRSGVCGGGAGAGCFRLLSSLQCCSPCWGGALCHHCCCRCCRCCCCFSNQCVALMPAAVCSPIANYCTHAAPCLPPPCLRLQGDFAAAIDDEWTIDAAAAVGNTACFHPVSRLLHPQPAVRCAVRCMTRCCVRCWQQARALPAICCLDRLMPHRHAVLRPRCAAQVHMNHSSGRANVRRFYARGERRISFFTTRDVQPGEELLYE